MVDLWVLVLVLVMGWIEWALVEVFWLFRGCCWVYQYHIRMLARRQLANHQDEQPHARSFNLYAA